MADLEGGLRGLHPPPFQISKIKERNKTNKKIRRQSSWKGKKEKKLKVCLVFMCTRVDLTPFFFQHFHPQPPPPFEKFLDPRLLCNMHSIRKWHLEWITFCTYKVYILVLYTFPNFMYYIVSFFRKLAIVSHKYWGTVFIWILYIVINLNFLLLSHKPQTSFKI